MMIRNFPRLFVSPVVIRKPSNFIRQVRKWVGYGLYTLVLLIGFLYVLFPYQKIQLWVENQVEEQMGIHMHAEQRKAGPFWFEWSDLRLSREHPSLINVFMFPTMTLHVDVRSMLSKSLRFSSEFTMWDGRGEGWMTVLPDDRHDGYHLQYSLTNLQMADAALPYMKSGLLSLDLDYQWKQREAFSGRGRANLSLESVQIEDLPLRVDKKIPLTIPSANGFLILEKDVMTFRDIHVQGAGFSFSGQGHMYMAPQILDGRLEGEGLLYLSQEFSQQFPDLQSLPTSPGQPIQLKFSGTGRNPVMELNGIPIPLEPSLLFSSMSSFPYVYQ